MKKLIYFTLGNNLNYLNLTKLCIDSLTKQNYDGDFLFITSFKEVITETIKVKNDIYFVELQNSNLLNSSVNKLKLYKFDRIKNYDKIIFCDLDILWTKSPDLIFDMIHTDEFYFSNENGLMSDEWWGKKLITIEEKTHIIKNQIKGVNAGIFAFNRNMIEHLKNMESFLNDNHNLVNNCLEQPFINIYLLRNSLYNTLLNDIVSHNGYNQKYFDGVVLHFAGGPGNYDIKYHKMKSFYDTFLKLNYENSKDKN